MQETLFRSGQNCAAIARAGRIGLIVDGADYYRAFMSAAARAERSINIIGWDFDSRTPLCSTDEGKPIVLGDFLNGLAAAKRLLRIYILDWDFPIVYGTDRELPLSLGLSWKPHRHIDFQFDNTHPIAGSHHQKIVVIDDRVAFVGGLDLTNKRWDTAEHKPGDPRRVFNGQPYPPMHDVMIAVDGEAAAALGRIARERWRAATGRTLKPTKPTTTDPWPADVAIDMSDVDVAISCTAPPTRAGPGVRQIEALYLDMIAQARRYIYIENQYFTSNRISAALAKRLAEPDGPEIVLVTRLLSHGWLEEKTMTVLRTKYVRELREADRHGHFHAYCPHIAGLEAGTCLDLHSKVMVIDDEWLRVGSSNLSNRSMGMDTECDVTVEARGSEPVRRAIRAFRDRLLAEHTDVPVDVIAHAVDSNGSIGKAIAAATHGTRRLESLEAPELSESAMAIAGIGDPEKPIFETIVGGDPARASSTRFPLKRTAAAVIFVAAILLALVWTHTPLADYVNRDNVLDLAEGVSKSWWTPLVLVIAYVPASLLMFPRWILTLVATVMYGPWSGFALGLCGCALGGVATFLPGRLVAQGTVRKLVGERVHRIATIVQKRGVIAVTLLRLVPIAPFPVVNLALGALRVRLPHFVVGTVLGMTPGTIATTVLSDQVAAALEDPAQINAWLVAGAAAALALLAYFGQHWLRRNPEWSRERG
jgi:phosphatidylserine/phosphatidylglycerophosphate/cardiolipin synthase-like enzyme/uncharacterized membrane protein YdjX (TVP38/TMEM64 family)